MGTWNYRIIKEVFDEEVSYSIREVYYDDAEEVVAEFYISLEDTGLTANTITELWSLYEKMGEAFELNVLTEDEDGELVETDDCAEDEEEIEEDEE
jgi:hypothetical protein